MKKRKIPSIKKYRFPLRLGLVVLLAAMFAIWPAVPKQTLLPEAGPEDSQFHLIIPKIKVEAPIIAEVDGSNKDLYLPALEQGVAHFKNTAKPGDGSNIFLFGHSSYYPFLPGAYKEIFRHLQKLTTGDLIIVSFKNRLYYYRVSETKIVEPEDVKALQPTAGEQITLMTCVPPGTTLKRLLVIGKPVQQ